MSDVYAEKPWLKSYDRNVPPELKYENRTFAEQFRVVADQYPDKTALHYMGKQITYREIDLLSNRLARYFQKIGLKPDDVVGLHMPNLPAHFIAIIAVQKAGCISTGLSPLLTPHEMEHHLNDSRAKVVITVDLLFDKVAEVAGKAPFTSVIVTEVADFLPGVKKVLGKLLKKIPTAPIGPVPGKTVVRFMEAIDGMPADPVSVRRTMDDTIFMMYTGGTTGQSRGAVLTQRSYMYNRQQLLTWIDIRPDDIALSAFPLFHIAGLTLGGVSITSGVTQVCVPNPRDSHFMVQALKAYRPTFMTHVPTVYFELIKNPEFKKVDMSGLKFCLSVAAPFPGEKIRELENIVGENKLIELYGMTESMVTCFNPRYGNKKPSSIGIPMSDTEFKLVDPETGQLAKLGDPGEIIIRGPQIMTGYYMNPEETARTLRDGWIYTGDIATMDEDGYFYIVDRVKDMVIVSGFKVFTRELDDLLALHPDVEMAAAIGIPDPARPGSERVALAVMLKPGIEKSEAEKEKILNFLKENVAPYKVPKVIQFMDQLPLSGVGKILKRELRTMM
jgi:acyl-CoA synthetase (AMP-forming)/AMP-acid ligase II